MITQKPAASRLPLKAASTAFAALLALGLPLAAQSRGHASGGGGGDRSAHSTGGGSHSSAPGGAPHYSGGSSNSGGNSGGGRTAHEVPGGSSAHRQPNGGRGNGGGHGHGGHGGGYYGGYGGYYGYGYPYGYYGGWGFWPGWGGYGYGYDYPYGYPYGYGYPGASGRYYESNRQGALDLDVAPGRTHVFIDGQDLGPVDRYDGWPGYLWLPQGTYDVAFYLDGYKTVARQLTVYPGTVLDVDDRLEEGQSVRPEALATKTHERRDDRLSYERQRRERLGRGNDNDDNQDWRDRARRDRDRGAMRNEDRDDDDDQADDRDDDRKIGSMSPSSGAHLRLSVEPEDASIYLDGQFVGTGSDISLLQAGLPVAPGTHRLAVVRPGHRAVEKQFDVKAGGDIKLDIELESGSGR
jgi:hypothetical protein